MAISYVPHPILDPADTCVSVSWSSAAAVKWRHLIGQAAIEAGAAAGDDTPLAVLSVSGDSDPLPPHWQPGPDPGQRRDAPPRGVPVLSLRVRMSDMSLSGCVVPATGPTSTARLGVGDSNSLVVQRKLTRHRFDPVQITLQLTNEAVT